MTEMFWVLTLQWPALEGVVTNTAAGTVTPAPGTTRREIFHDVLAKARAQLGASGTASVLFFDLAPNQHPGTPAARPDPGSST
jgi:hypothetical protein